MQFYLIGDDCVEVHITHLNIHVLDFTKGIHYIGVRPYTALIKNICVV